MARFYVDLTLWFSADIADDDDLARVYPDIASRVKGKYGVQAFNLRQAPEVVGQEEQIPAEEQQLPEQLQEQIPEQELQQEQELEPEPVVPTTPPPAPTKKKKQAPDEEEEEEEDEYEEAEEQQ